MFSKRVVWNFWFQANSYAVYTNIRRTCRVRSYSIYLRTPWFRLWEQRIITLWTRWIHRRHRMRSLGSFRRNCKRSCKVPLSFRENHLIFLSNRTPSDILGIWENWEIFHMISKKGLWKYRKYLWNHQGQNCYFESRFHLYVSTPFP